MKLFYFGWREHGTNFGIVPAENKEEAIEKYKAIARAKDKEKEEDFGRKLGKHESYSNPPIIEEIIEGIYLDNHN